MSSPKPGPTVHGLPLLDFITSLFWLKVATENFQCLGWLSEANAVLVGRL